MKIIKKILLLIFLITLLSSCGDTYENKKYSNVVVLLVDDLGYFDLPNYGNTFHETPNINALASISTKFTQAYAPAPICSPSRASILTGRYTTTLEITDFMSHGNRRIDTTKKLLPAPNKNYLDTKFTTLASVLSENGYKTASIGKWHLGGEGSMPENHGFQVNIGGNHRGMPDTYYYPYNKNGKESVIPNLQEDMREGEYLTDRVTREAVKFIEKNKKDPFFLYLPYYTVHIPIEGKDHLVKKFTKRAKDMELENQNIHYAAMVASLDESIGSVLQTLKKNKLHENTIIIFASDNGGLHTYEGLRTPATSNGNLRQGKGWLYDGGIKIPLLVHKPKQSSPFINEQPVSLTGIFATLLDLLEIESNISLDSKSFFDTNEEPLFWHYPHYSNQGGTPSSAIRKGDFKLIYFYENQKKELYNLKEDPSEQNDISTTHLKKTDELFKELNHWLEKTNAKYPKQNKKHEQNNI